MVGTFLYLSACEMRNRIRVRLRRLREPRYLVGSVVGVVYLYYFVFYQTFHSGQPGRGNVSMMTAFAKIAGPIQFVASAALLLLGALVWLLPGSRKPIEFSRAEVQFLFQAPLSRRQLLNYKLLRSQLGLVFGSAVATLMLRPTTLIGSWTLLVGVWLVLTLARLYSLGVSLSREGVTRLGPAGLTRQWAPGAIVTGAVGVLVVTVALDWSRLAALTDAGSVFEEIRQILSTGAAGLVLWPFRLVVRLPMASSATEFLSALPGVLALIALTYVWVLLADAAFEDVSAHPAKKRAIERRASRIPTVKSMPTPFTLAPDGRAETAIVWKNLIMVGRYASLSMLVRLAPLVVLVAIAGGRSGSRGGMVSIAALVCLLFASFTIVLGPQTVRNDLRQDLANLAVLKTWPIRGTALLRGEILAPAVVLTAVVWLLLLGGGLLFGSLPIRGEPAATIMRNRVSYTVAAMIVAPLMILAQLVVQNGAAVMFPAWVAVNTSRARGIDAMGQRLLMMAGLLLALVLSLLPGVLVAAAFAFAAYVMTGVIFVILPAIIVAGVILVECALATDWLGRVLERTDVGALGPVE
jgi:hypothetical protein